ncbi:hypothetical protein [Caballeronia sordidicola]|uniref:hypothetical protein n=1 Tax=Caballeronia sordidicola TaxID=196367 RepID=UPI000A3BDDD4|nr:hypothetical protein [Caballeronia sordidicola]
MKDGKRIVVAGLFAVVSTIALAQSGGAGGNAGGGNGNGGSGGGNAHSAATAGMTSGGDPASGTIAKSGKTHKKMARKSATDTTNMPGADASSDTKGQ